ncbi:acyl-ACP--UDP-N-acetylglucosamine O-acyltransferase [Larsenimonas rhizosphaerae]|uniref:Acyl-[acyl-carrier-protein]--UDP-N-acetylglucosamine O-acyltransferase n=1 Tax=Larsenimonas rhizosphaerae TaxID=2944682 RepID=A0AA42CU60_9GAMM|nr:acyl-ACP--UDP-N-acetylglucosamine O-acyltransferase [Larsenimonas rhizosphaerae]MCM2129674.1 acyl-ACP--UDP-N-acetylglucosamine O-acyltransferase [Larsenimonas rhizosphaerae]MCX2524332.1 acyl-ACP--UDP-N-acetylglucosamine O-acyltransferase [Larsenimonas rhizosphaerae]
MIHSTAIIDPSAVIADDVDIGPFCVVGADVEIGSGCVIGPHSVISGPTRIGINNRIFQFTSIGEECQDKKYAGEPTRLEIGDYNTFREGVTVHRGTTQDKELTRIGSHGLFMAYAHVAHDCDIGDHVIMANQATLGGHVHIGDHVILGGLSAVHQFCHIGDHAMCGGGSIVTKDVPAYTMANGHPAHVHGLNLVGLKRRGFSRQALLSLQTAYKRTWRQGLTLEQAIDSIEQDDALTGPEIDVFIASLKASERGITR